MGMGYGALYTQAPRSLDSRHLVRLSAGPFFGGHRGSRLRLPVALGARGGVGRFNRLRPVRPAFHNAWRQPRRPRQPRKAARKRRATGGRQGGRRETRCPPPIAVPSHLPAEMNDWADALSRLEAPEPRVIPPALAALPRTPPPDLDKIWLASLPPPPPPREGALGGAGSG